MLDAVSLTGCGPAAYAAQAASLMQLRAQDAQIRSRMQSSAVEAGSGATVNLNVTYTIGPDGQRYATGMNISTTRKDVAPGSRVAGTPIGQVASAGEDVPDAANQNAPRRAERLADYLGVQLGLSPLEFAQAFGQEFNDGLTQSRLQAEDAGVRSQERQHFRAAGGLGSAPIYELVAGPDGALYAVAGHVDIDPAATTDPAKAARDAATIAIAATAPGDASAQDFAVARGALADAARHYGVAEMLGDEKGIDLAA